jgi:hypothetical protein
VSNTPTLREQREAYLRRARVINRLHAEATATSDRGFAQHRAIEAKIRAIVLRRRARFLLVSSALIAFALACAFALVGMIVMAF